MIRADAEVSSGGRVSSKSILDTPDILAWCDEEAPSLEFRLAAACTIWPVSVARIRLAAHGVDHRLFLRVVKRHGIAGLAANALRHAGETVPPELDRVAHRRGRAALRQTGEALRLEALLAQRGIAALFLKGSSLAHHVYGVLGIRDSVDIDIAIRPDRVVEAWDVLTGAGYTAEIPRCAPSGAALTLFLSIAKDSSHRHPKGAIVELHWRLSDDLADPGVPPPKTWRRVKVTPDRTLAMLDDEAMFVYLCVHGAAHGWARLKWLADIAALVTASDDAGAAYWRAAQRAKADIAAASALLLAQRFLATDLSEDFVAPRSLRLRLLLRIAVRTMIAGGGARDLATSRYRGWVEFAAKLLIAPNARSVAATVRRIAVSAEDIGMLALPAYLAWLYPLVRVPMLVRRRMQRSMVRRARISISASRTP